MNLAYKKSINICSDSVSYDEITVQSYWSQNICLKCSYFKRNLRRTWIYLLRIGLSNLTYIMSLANLMSIGGETKNI